MPDINGALSDDERRRIADWLNAKNGPYPCPVCNSRNWTVAPHAVGPSVVNGAGIGLGAYPYPFVPIVSDCGYTFFMNLVVIGIYPRGSG
jgi:hypothetical protein